MTKARDNPLSSDRVLAIRYRPQGWTWDDLIARLAAMRYRAAIVGPKGTGKTTLLEDLAGHIERRGFRCRLIRLSASENRIDPRQFDAVRADDVILVDGAEQLSVPRWLRVRLKTRRAGGLIVTTHRPGRLPTLLTTHTTPQLLGHILAELIPSGMPDRLQVDHLFHKHTGNLREALRELYDRFARAA